MLVTFINIIIPYHEKQGRDTVTSLNLIRILNAYLQFLHFYDLIVKVFLCTEHIHNDNLYSEQMIILI